MQNQKHKAISPQAERALKEAAERRARQNQEPLEKEYSGRKGPEATRFGDWEKNGTISDF